MKRSDARKHFLSERQNYGSLVAALEPALTAVEELYRKSVADGVDPWVLNRALRGCYAYSKQLHEARVGLATAEINLSALESRFGEKERAEAAHARLMPEVERTKARFEMWEKHAVARNLTLPKERRGVDISVLADAELRAVYRAFKAGAIDKAEATRRVGDAAAVWDVSDADLDAWQKSQGFEPLVD